MKTKITRTKRRFILVSTIILLTRIALIGQALYVDNENGNDSNSGTANNPLRSIHKAMELVYSADNDYYTIKINPGIYVLNTYVDVATEKSVKDRRITIEARYLPGHAQWTSENMPIIMSVGPKGEIPNNAESFITCFLVNSSNVTIRGFRFLGNPIPNARSFGVARFNKAKKGLLVEQCMFLGEEIAMNLQSGIIAHGSDVDINHCVFYKSRNAIVFWEAATGQTSTYGNSFTNNIVYGMAQTAIWTCTPDDDFIFENNIVSNSQYVWLVDTDNNNTAYTMDSCVIVNNGSIEGDWAPPGPGDFDLTMTDVVTEGDISVTWVPNLDGPLPDDFLHIVPGTLGSELNAGLFIPRSDAPKQYDLWYTAGDNGSISGTISQVVEENGSGTEVTAIPNDGFRFSTWSDGETANPRTDSDVTKSISVTAVFTEDLLSITEKKSDVVKVYPNPTNGNLYVEMANKDRSIINSQLIDMLGKVETTEMNKDGMMNISHLAEGVYVLKMELDNGTIYSESVILHN